MHTVYVYGTLRPGTGATVNVPGELYDLGWFPGAKLLDPLSPSCIVCEAVFVDDATLARLDDYEGYSAKYPEQSLYLRKEYNGGFIYTYNQPFDGKFRIPSGDCPRGRCEPATGQSPGASSARRGGR